VKIHKNESETQDLLRSVGFGQKGTITVPNKMMPLPIYRLEVETFNFMATQADLTTGKSLEDLKEWFFTVTAKDFEHVSTFKLTEEQITQKGTHLVDFLKFKFNVSI